MRRRILRGGAASLVVAILLAGGCTEPPIGWEGAGRQQTLPEPGNDASIGDGEAGLGSLNGLCIPKGVVCHNSGDCCNGVCTGGQCPGLSGGPYCAPNGVVCVDSNDCCDGYCGGGVCGDTPSPMCAPEFIICNEDTDCCNSGSDGPAVLTCVNGACCGVQKDCSSTSTPPLCVPYGVVCGSSDQCCTGGCYLNTDLIKVCAVAENP